MEADAITLNNLGVVLHEWGDILGARQAYEAALTRMPGWIPPETLSNIGLTQWQVGEVAGAVESFRRARAARANDLPERFLFQTDDAALARAAILAEELHPIVALEQRIGAGTHAALGLQVLFERKSACLTVKCARWLRFDC